MYVIHVRYGRQCVWQLSSLGDRRLRKTYLRYPGGKSKAIKNLKQFIPDFEEYRETMVGGGSMFLYLKSLYPDKKYWINDLYTNLYLFWMNCRDNNNEMVDRLLEIKNKTSIDTARNKFNEIKESILEKDDITKGVYFYYLNKCSFSGLTESGTCSPLAWKQNFSVESIKSLSDLKDILVNVKITNLDYRSVLSKEGNNVFIYLDPPYEIGKQNMIYGKDGEIHRSFDHDVFAFATRDLPHKIMISYNDSEAMRKRFYDFRVHDVEFKYVMRQNKSDAGLVGKTKNELVICNYEQPSR